MKDTFRGDTPHLISCIEALLRLDADGALVPHGIGGHARDLLAAAAVRLAAATIGSHEEAHSRIYDLLLGDDGQAQKEARKYLERSAPELAALLAQPAPVQQPHAVPDSVWEALQRLIENAASLGPASQDDALLVAKYRDRARFMAAPVQPCKLCNGTRMVDDGEITHHECGIPYENGPVKCVKDCPACCGDSRAATAQAGPQQTGGRMLVPVDPTPAMLYALWQHRDAMRGTSENKIARESYRAMLAAAPLETGEGDAR